jgi:hypothetical protein
MNPKISILCAALCLSFTAVAQTSPEAPATTSAPEAVKATAPTQAAASKGQLPKLSIKWQCKEECSANEKVPPLIEEAYAKAAQGNGYAVSDSEVAEVTIVEFRQRPPAVRVTLGLFAGKDKLGVKINYRGKEASADDTSSNAIQGMNSLSETVGKRSYEQIVAIFKSTSAATAAN